MNYQPARSQIFRIHQHRRYCANCGQWKFIKGGTMVRDRKSLSPMANKFCCADCRAPEAA